MSNEIGAQVPLFPQREYNGYVPGMQYAVAVGIENILTVDFGTPALADADAILDGQSIATAGTTTTLLDDEADAPFGRNITVVASGAATSTVTIVGRDYLGQPVKKTMTLNGATPVVGTVAFKWIDYITYGATSATTIDVGWGSALGLPYRCIKALSELFDKAPQTVGTLTAPVYTDPGTATTGDPRGIYTATGTLNGAKRLVCVFLTDPSVTVDSDDKLAGGLYGVKHYFA